MEVKLRPRRDYDAPVMVGSNVLIFISIKGNRTLYDITNNIYYHDVPKSPRKTEAYILERYGGDIRVLSAVEFIYHPMGVVIEIDGLLDSEEVPTISMLAPRSEGVELICYSQNT